MIEEKSKIGKMRAVKYAWRVIINTLKKAKSP
jgi:hypothetical protein